MIVSENKLEMRWINVQQMQYVVQASEVHMKIRRDMIKLMVMAQANQDNPIVSKQQHYVSLANGWAATIVEKTN